MKKEIKGAFLTLFGGFCWGASGSMGQYLFTYEGMDSRWLVPIRLGLAGVILFVFSLLHYGRKTFDPWRERKDRIDLVIYGLAGISLCQFFYFTTIQLSSASMATILQDLSPIMILVVTCFSGHRKPTAREITAVVLAIGGIVLLTTHGSFTHPAISATALLTGILSAVCVTIYNTEPARLLKRYPVVILQAWAFLMGSAVFSLLFRPSSFHYTPTPMGWFGIAFVVIVGNVLAFTCYMDGVALIGPSKSILYGFSEPVTAAIISALFMKTSFTVYDFIGFALIFLMLVLISHHPASKKAS